MIQNKKEVSSNNVKLNIFDRNIIDDKIMNIKKKKKTISRKDKLAYHETISSPCDCHPENFFIVIKAHI